MTELGGEGDRYRFDPRDDAQSAQGGVESEPTNVCRAAALAMLLRSNSGSMVAPLAQPLESLGFAQDVIMRPDSMSTFAAVSDWFVGPDVSFTQSDSRQAAWSEFNENLDAAAAMRFLVGLLGSHLERESVAGAAALRKVLSDFPFVWPDLDDFTRLADRDDSQGGGWDSRTWRRLFDQAMLSLGAESVSWPFPLLLLRYLVRLRLREAALSSDPVTRSLANAVRLNEDRGATRRLLGSSISTPPGALVVSTMVHGTFGWKGDWWRPKGQFHQYIAANHRPNMYNRGARFSWSGAYSQRQRIVAAEDLVDWGTEVAPNGLQSVFAHSYGGEVAALATMAGAATQELVMLSVPGTGFINAAASLVSRVVDVRLPFDPVLAIANTPQRLSPASNLVEVLLDWSLDHGASHNEDVWVVQDVAARGSL